MRIISKARWLSSVRTVAPKLDNNHCRQEQGGLFLPLRLQIGKLHCGFPRYFGIRLFNNLFCLWRKVFAVCICLLTVRGATPNFSAVSFTNDFVVADILSATTKSFVQDTAEKAGG